MFAPRRQGELRLPLPEAVFAFISPELGRLPTLAAVDRQIHACYAAIATKGDAARLRRRAHRHRVTRTDVRDERSGKIPCNRHQLESGLTRVDGVVWLVGNPVARRRPIVRVRLIEHLDVVQHLDPIDSAPAGDDQFQRESVQQLKLFAVHAKCDHHFPVARVIDSQRFHEFRLFWHDRLVQATEAYLQGAWFHAGPIQYVLQADTGPKRIAHRSVRPLGAGNSRLHINAGIAGTLADRSKLHAWQSMKDILGGQRQRLVYMPTYGQPKFVEVDLARKVGPVPAHIMLIIRREHALVENLKWGFEPGRAS